LGLSLLRVPVTCGNGLQGAIVFTKGYKEPDLETRPGGKSKATPAWAAFFTTDLSLTAPQVVHKYLGRWPIEVFFKEAKQRLGLGQEPGRAFAAQVFSVTLAFPLQPAGLSPGARQTVPDQRRHLPPVGRRGRQAHLSGAAVALPRHFPAILRTTTERLIESILLMFVGG
jgi:hypothetical protein